jgi:hypothetical protein
MLKWASPISRQFSDERSPLSLVSYLSKFACNNSANKHHTSHLGDCDVAPLTESDSSQMSPGVFLPLKTFNYSSISADYVWSFQNG